MHNCLCEGYPTPTLLTLCEGYPTPSLLTLCEGYPTPSLLTLALTYASQSLPLALRTPSLYTLYYTLPITYTLPLHPTPTPSLYTLPLHPILHPPYNLHPPFTPHTYTLPLHPYTLHLPFTPYTLPLHPTPSLTPSSTPPLHTMHNHLILLVVDVEAQGFTPFPLSIQVHTHRVTWWRWREEGGGLCDHGKE